MTGHLLVIGYGNELRRDDGVGPRAARAVAGWRLPGTRALAVQQLTPELAELIVEAERVVFVDASQHQQQAVETHRLELNAPPVLMHISDPQALLALTAAIYGRAPTALLISVHSPDLTLGFGLSTTAKRCLKIALQAIRAMAEP